MEEEALRISGEQMFRYYLGLPFDPSEQSLEMIMEEEEVLRIWGKQMFRYNLGFRFDPSDLVLALDYLQVKVNNGENSLPSRAVVLGCNIYAQEPWILTGAGQERTAKIGFPRYYFSERKKKNSGKTPKREAGKGYWRATQKPHDIYDDNIPPNLVAQKRAFAYYAEDHVESSGKKKGSKTHWLMDEYELKANEFQKQVICIIKCKPRNDADEDDNMPTMPNDIDFHNQLPPDYPFTPVGYAFKPTPQELLFYLYRNDKSLVLPSYAVYKIVERIGGVYDMEPWVITGANGPDGEMDEKYYFTKRTSKRKDRNGNSNDYGKNAMRAAGNGYWKKTGKMDVKNNEGCIIGEVGKFKYHYKNTDGTAEKTNWIMHEFTLSATNTANEIQFQKHAICKIRHRKQKAQKDYGQEEDKVVDHPT